MSVLSYTAWTQVRQKSNITVFVDLFRQRIAGAQETASCTRTEDKADKSLYATLVDTFACGMEVGRTDAIFEDIPAAIVPLISRVLGNNTTTTPDTSPLSSDNNFPIDQQAAL